MRPRIEKTYTTAIPKFSAIDNFLRKFAITPNIPQDIPSQVPQENQPVGPEEDLGTTTGLENEYEKQSVQEGGDWLNKPVKPIERKWSGEAPTFEIPFKDLVINDFVPIVSLVENNIDMVKPYVKDLIDMLTNKIQNNPNGINWKNYPEGEQEYEQQKSEMPVLQKQLLDEVALKIKKVTEQTKPIINQNNAKLEQIRPLYEQNSLKLKQIKKENADNNIEDTSEEEEVFNLLTRLSGEKRKLEKQNLELNSKYNSEMSKLNAQKDEIKKKYTLDGLRKKYRDNLLKNIKMPTGVLERNRINLFRFSKEEKDLINEIGDAIFNGDTQIKRVSNEPTNNPLKNRLKGFEENLVAFEPFDWFYSGVPEYNEFLEKIAEYFGNHAIEIKNDIIKQNPGLNEKQIASLWLQEKPKLVSQLDQIRNYMEKMTEKLLGFDIELLETSAPLFDKDFMSRGELDRFIFILQSLLKTSKQMSNSNENPAQKSLQQNEVWSGENVDRNVSGEETSKLLEPEKFDDTLINDSGQFENLPPERQKRMSREIERQRRWVSLLSDISNPSSRQAINRFLYEYSFNKETPLNLNTIISTKSAWDEKNPMPDPNVDKNLYDKWMGAKLANFVLYARNVGLTSGASLSSGVGMDGVPDYVGQMMDTAIAEEMKDVMIAISAGVEDMNQNGIQRVNFKLKDLQKSFPKRDVNGKGGFEIDELISAFSNESRIKYRLDDDATSNTARKRLKQLNEIWIKLNQISNEINLIRDMNSQEEESSKYKSEGSSKMSDLCFRLISGANEFFEIYKKQNPSSLGVYREVSFSDGKLGYLNSIIKGETSWSLMSSLNKVKDAVASTCDCLDKLATRRKYAPQKEKIISIREKFTEFKKQLQSIDVLAEETELKTFEESVRLLKEHLAAIDLTNEVEGQYGFSPLFQVWENNKSDLDAYRELVVELFSSINSSIQHKTIDKTIKKNLTLIINLLREASDEHLGISSAFVGSEDHSSIMELRGTLNEIYNEILNPNENIQSLESERQTLQQKIQELRDLLEGNPSPEIEKELRKNEAELNKVEYRIKNPQKGIPGLVTKFYETANIAEEAVENMLSDFMDADSNKTVGARAYNSLKDNTAALNSTTANYGDYLLLLANKTAQEDFKYYNEDEDDGQKKLKKKLIKSYYRVDNSTNEIRFVYKREDATGITTDEKSYEVGDDILERNLISRTIVDVVIEPKTNLIRTHFHDFYYDPNTKDRNGKNARVKLNEDPGVVYSVLQNPTTLNNIVKELMESLNNGLIGSKEDIIKVCKILKGTYSSNPQMFKILNSLSSAENDAKIVGDLYDKILLQDIYSSLINRKYFKSNPFMDDNSLKASLKQVQELYGIDKSKERQVIYIMKLLKDSSELNKLKELYKTKTIFSTEIGTTKPSIGKKQISPWKDFLNKVPEAKDLELNMNELPKSFEYDTQLTNLIHSYYDSNDKRAAFDQIQDYITKTEIRKISEGSSEVEELEDENVSSLEDLNEGGRQRAEVEDEANPEVGDDEGQFDAKSRYEERKEDKYKAKEITDEGTFRIRVFRELVSKYSAMVNFYLKSKNYAGLKSFIVKVYKEIEEKYVSGNYSFVEDERTEEAFVSQIIGMLESQFENKTIGSQPNKKRTKKAFNLNSLNKDSSVPEKVVFNLKRKLN